MQLPVTTRPRLAPTLFGLVLLPLLGLGAAVCAGFPAVLGGESFLCASLIFGALAILIWYVAAVMFWGWFTLHIDESGIVLVGLFGWRRLVLRWPDIEAAGVVRRGPFPVLAVRSRQPWARKPWGVLKWHPQQRLLEIAGIENWMLPADDLVATVRYAAGEAWSESLDPDPTPGPDAGPASGHNT